MDNRPDAEEGKHMAQLLRGYEENDLLFSSQAFDWHGVQLDLTPGLLIFLISPTLPVKLTEAASSV